MFQQMHDKEVYQKNMILAPTNSTLLKMTKLYVKNTRGNSLLEMPTRFWLKQKDFKGNSVEIISFQGGY